MAAKSPDEILTPAALQPDFAGAILVGGKLVTLEAIRAAAKLGVRGIVVGGLNDDDLRAMLGFDLGVAITGHEKLGLSLVITEGFGQIEIARKTFDLLAKHAGQQLAQPGRHGSCRVIRPGNY